MQFTTTHKEEHKKRSRRGSSFFLTRPFSTFLIFYRTLHLETCALTRFFSQKRVVVCLLSLSSFSFIATTARGVKIYI